MSLTYLASTENFKSLTYKFGGNHEFLGFVFKAFVQHMYNTFYHKISGNFQIFYSESDFRKSSELIYNRVAFSSKEINECDNKERDKLVELRIKKIV